MLREEAAEARRDIERDPQAAQFHEGELIAFQHVLSLMQTQADAFQIERARVGLDDFDPFGGNLDPTAPKR